jgi:hypothetical protein
LVIQIENIANGARNTKNSRAKTAEEKKNNDFVKKIIGNSI